MTLIHTKALASFLGLIQFPLKLLVTTCSFQFVLNISFFINVHHTSNMLVSPSTPVSVVALLSLSLSVTICV